MCLRIIAIYVQCYTPELLALRLKIHTISKTKTIHNAKNSDESGGKAGSGRWRIGKLKSKLQKIRKNKSPGPPFPTPPSANLPNMKLPSRADLAEPP